MKHLNFNFKSIVQSKARWLLTLFAILTIGIGQMWATATSIPANTIIYVDVTNFHDDSHTGNDATDSKYYVSKPNKYNVEENRYTTDSYTDGAGSYWAAGDSTWVELTNVSGNIYCFKTSDKWWDGKLSLWTKKQDTYDHPYKVCIALLQEYDGTNNLFTLSSGKTYHSTQEASCFGTTTSVMSTFTAGSTLYLDAGTYWDVDKALFRAYFFDGQNSTWATCTSTSASHVYSVTVPSGSWTHMIFVRKDPSTNVEDSWTGMWNQTSDMTPNGVENCVSITAAGNNNQSWGRFALTPALSGDFNDWSADADVFDANGEVSVALDANSAYEIKVVSGTTWYGIDDTYVYGQEDTYTLVGTQASIKLHTASIDGTYKFTWDAANSELSIEYPDVPHPNAGYVYFLNDQSWNPVAIHVWGGTEGYGTTWGSNPAISSFNWDGTDYYYAAMGNHTSVIFGQGIDDSHKTADLSKNDGLGKYYKKSETAGWYDFTATLTLATNQGETTNPSPTSVTVTYGASTNINTDVISTSPQKTGYTFGGYYTEVGGGGTQVITSAEKIPSALAGYTAGEKWIKTGSSVSATLYAKWTETVTLNNQGADAGKGGTANFTATYNSSTGLTTITKPQKTGYIFSGYYTLSYGSGKQIIDADGNFNTSVTGFITDGKWTRPAGSAVTLYAYWKKECSASSYTLRYFNTGTVAYNSACFSQVGETHEWNITNFAIPSETNYSVGYNEDVYESDLGSANSSSVSKAWTDTYSEGNGAMQLLPAGASARAVGQATGAVGKLVIWDNSSDKNLSVGFLPNGYGLTYAAGTIAFNNWGSTFCETNVVTLTSADASGNFQVKLATSDSYVACAQGTAEAASAVNGRKISGGDDIANGKKGVFQMWTDATANNFGLRFVTVHDVTFNANGHGVAPSAFTDVRYNNKIGEPTAPEDVSGWAFVGWYKEAACTNKWNFETDVVTENTTIYAKWRHTGVYTFHYGEAPASTPNDDDIMGWDVDWTGTVVAFPATPTRTSGSEGTYTEEYDITNFTIPDPSDAPKFFVCYEEKFKTNLNTLGQSAASKVRAWNESFTSSGNTHGYIKVLPGFNPLSDGDTKTAEGATGKLTIRHSASAGGENLNIGFTPSGYGLTIVDQDEAKTVIAFHSTENPNLWETDILPSGLTAKQVAGTFKVGLATATSADDNIYVDCYQSSAAAVSTINAEKVTGTPDVAAGAKGRFQILIDRSKTNFGLRYVPTENKAKGGTWSYYTSWNLGHVPTIDEDVIIDNGWIMDVDIPNAQAKSVKIDRSVNSITRLRITPTGGLLVKEGITAKHDGEDSFGATNRWDVYIRTDISGNGGLICGDRSTNTSVMYEFYTKAYKYRTWYINQYVGIPFESMNAYKLYGFNIFEYSAADDDWRTPGSSTMDSWKAYNLIRQYDSDDWAYFDLDGVLNLPGTNNDKDGEGLEYRKNVLTCGTRTTGTSIDKVPGHQDYLFANSWTAPISIKHLQASDCSDTDTSDEVEGGDLVHTIYIFNAGYVAPNEDKILGTGSGTWSSFPFESSKYMSDAVIPATQAFMVTATVSTGAKLTLDYKKHVYDPALNADTINTYPTRAPRRITMDSNDPRMLKITVNSNDTTIADRLYLFQRGDFKNDAFDDGWDGYKIEGENYAAEIYTVRGNANMAVDAVKDMNNTSIAFKASNQDSEYTLSFEYEPDGTPLYFYDKTTLISTEIENGATYTFTADDTKAHERFLLTRSNSPQIATGVEEIDTENVQRAQKFMQDQQIFIRRGDKVYSIDGALVK